MGDAARFPEAHRLAPLGLGADPDSGPGIDADAGRIAPRRLGHPAQLVECRDRLVARRVVERHPAIAPFDDALHRHVGMAAEPDRDPAACWQRIDPGTSIVWYLPAKVTCGSAHSACMTSTCSSERPRLRKFSLRPTNSTG